MLSVAPSFCTFTPLTHRQIAMATPTPKSEHRDIMQNLIHHPDYYNIRIRQLVVKEADITERLLTIFSTDKATGAERADPLGISVGYTKEGKLAALAIADEARCCVIEFARSPPPTRQAKVELLQKHVFCRSIGEIYAFDAAQLAMALWLELGIKVARAVDIQSSFTDSDFPSDRKALFAIRACFGDSEACKLNEKNIDRAFNDLTYNVDDINRMRVDILERAWISRSLPSHENGISTFSNVKYVDTSQLDEQFLKTLDALARVSEDSRRVGYLQPTATNHQFSHARSSLLSTGGKSIDARASAYKDRFRSSQNVIATIELESGEQILRRGQTGIVTGMSTTVDFDTSVMCGSKNVVSITSTGRDQPTVAEGKRDGIIRRTLQGNLAIFKENPWINNILLHNTNTDQDPPSILEWPEGWFPPSRSDIQKSTIQSSDCNPARHHLNKSQQRALDHMLSQDPITLIQGPPGKSGIWLIAQSNVAVKNIAEKLLKTCFMDWKLLVSEDFRNEWHDDLYEKIISHVISSKNFKFVSSQQLRNIRVFLCTLNMLSHFFINKFTFIVPFKCMVVDEASQIKVAEYINIWTEFDSLRKICFIGDNKQLPPFGAESVDDLKSIFEIDHLYKNTFLLDIQYRMPPQLGDFISQAVYNNELKSNLSHPIQNDTIACHFVNVIDSRERQSTSRSFINDAEAAIAIQLASYLQEQQMKYKIITPYDGQRNKIQNDMKNIDGLDWQDKCFNVDSFQGNEEDYIIISLVRSRSIGFLDSLRRTNVMLTRCKKGMYILTSRSFIDGAGESSLAGELANHVGKEAWLTVEDVVQGRI
ncbi:P-loop containing nucleoside triphosphate hydrolase protein [Desarmillaria ectypa]|nr:P-loop containing nucleoside triphosphate hydrolase protein [Desarmillaria ectypa]